MSRYCRQRHHNWECTLESGHDGPHKDRSLVDGFVYLEWPQEVGFPEHDGQGPDVDPATGDERATTDENGEPL